MFVVFFFLLGLSLLIIQTTLFSAMPDWLGRPDLLFIFIIFITVRLEIIQGAFLVLMLGLIMDIFSGIFLGLYPVTNLILFFIIHFLSRRFMVSELPHQIPLVLTCYLFTNTMIFISTAILEPENILPWNWIAIFFQMLLLSILTIPFFALYDFFLSLRDTPAVFRLLSRQQKGNRFRE
ncbi:MAG: rod shape-determining protein MreD [Desulfobulbaceae bacterium]|uniref:Rod shape-determining protein MreD n=1 Tax=Candidatus Desulfobia pelagia TaxID=2841692 RepID=A0A8J6TGD7_9BACT|nr:rod shape-determining protein MreD [Candidatus Desulfobia pelagia]